LPARDAKLRTRPGRPHVSGRFTYGETGSHTPCLSFLHQRLYIQRNQFN